MSGKPIIDPLKRLVEAYTAKPENPALVQQLNHLAWEAFHDPWEIPPAYDPPKARQPRRISLDADETAPADLPSPRAKEVMTRGRIPLDDHDVEIEAEVQLKGLNLARQALLLRGINFIDEGDSLLFGNTQPNEARPMPSLRVRFLQGRSQMLSVKASWRVSSSAVTSEDVFRRCNRYNRSHRYTQVVVLEPSPSDPTIRVVWRCVPIFWDDLSVDRLGSLLCRFWADFASFWGLFHGENHEGNHPE